MPERVAIVTLTIGSQYAKTWQTCCEAGWRGYANRHGFDVICIDEPLDSSARAGERSPAWQKCLILSQPFSRAYDRIVWVDADVVIRPAAPSIVAGVPVDAVGGVNEFNRPGFPQAMERLAHQVRQAHAGLDDPPLGFEYDARTYYTRYGLTGGCDQVLQTGVLVLSPTHHRELLEHVYRSYEERGAPRWHYEMRPLSYEIVSAGRVHWIDRRFNQDWIIYRMTHYPVLTAAADPSAAGRFKRRLATLADRLSRGRITRACAASAYRDSYFLHFAGARPEMEALASMFRPDMPDRS